MGNNKKWVRLKKVLQKIHLIKITPSRGDGAIISDSLTVVGNGNKVTTSPSFTIQDSVVVARPKK